MAEDPRLKAADKRKEADMKMKEIRQTQDEIINQRRAVESEVEHMKKDAHEKQRQIAKTEESASYRAILLASSAKEISAAESKKKQTEQELQRKEQDVKRKEQEVQSLSAEANRLEAESPGALF